MNENPEHSETSVQTNTSGELPELYNPDAAGLWSILLTPVFGSWCVWKNYKVLGDKSKEKVALIAMIVCLVYPLIFIFIFPNRAGGSAISLLIVWYFAIQKPQSTFLKKNGIQYRKKSLVSPVLCGLAAAVAWYLLIFGICMLLVSSAA